MAPHRRLQSKYQHFLQGHRTKFIRHLAQPYTPSHSQVLATIRCHRQRPSQPTTTTSPQTILQRHTTNTHHHTFTDATQLNVRSKHSKITSSPDLPALTPIFHYPTGVVCSLRPNSPSNYFAPPDSTPNFLPTPNSKAPSISSIHC